MTHTPDSAPSSFSSRSPTCSWQQATAPSTDPQWTDEELAIIAAHRGFPDTLVETLVDPAVDTEQLRPLTSARLAESVVDLVQADREGGVVNRGTADIRAVQVHLLSDAQAEVEYCMWGQIEEVTDGVVTVEAVPAPVLRTDRLVAESGTWRWDGRV